MADSNEHVSASATKARRLPSPGCLFALTLLVIVATVGGWIGWRVHQRRAQLRYFEQIGAQFRTTGLANVEALDLSHTTISDADLHRLSGLSELKLLHLLHHLTRLPSLQEVYLRDTDITDAGLMDLSSLPLFHLYLDNTQVSDVGLRHLKSLPNLMELSVSNTRVTDDGVNELQSQFPNAIVHR